MVGFGPNANGDAEIGTVQTADELVTLADEYRGLDDPSGLTVIGTEDALKSVRDDFALATQVQGLVQDDVFTLLVGPEVMNTVFSDGESITTVVNTGGEYVTLETDNSSDVDQVTEYLDELEAQADEFALRTAPYEEIVESLEEVAGSDAADQFESLYQSHDFNTLVDGVTAMLIVTAYNDGLLYDISRAGEDIRVASKATFSRKKTALEDAGIINTEKVPVDIGRPRQRLVISDELEGRPVEDVVAEAEDALAELAD